MEMNGSSIYITDDDLNDPGVDNLEMLHDGDDISLPNEAYEGHMDEVLTNGQGMVNASEIPALKSE